MIEPEWIEWYGGDCPVDANTQVAYRLRDGKECQPQYADGLMWDHIGVWNDIVAYRPVQHD